MMPGGAFVISNQELGGSHAYPAFSFESHPMTSSAADTSGATDGHYI